MAVHGILAIASSKRTKGHPAGWAFRSICRPRQLFFDNGVAKATGGEEGDRLIAIPGFDRLAKGLTELVAAHRGRRVWRVRVDHDRHAGYRFVVHHAAIDVVKGMADGTITA